eukprot:CAMPEP_0185795960 /NCGR_PEP_ID=MMETSP1174-20130828/160823_1 /TAXON_ID=35687 /ORGANISM="Dictyocha speculum, Strain CCMP1381" /LENGTH=78 /DNA_ID=CAMNT_0028491287 /DNA_START=145 /DNA_END=381 /DNA_ORIENTATION=+
MIRGSRIPHLYVKYDDLRSSPDAWCQVLNFLGISCTDILLLQTSLSKEITSPRKDVIRNYDEVVRALHGSPHEWMLYA